MSNEQPKQIPLTVDPNLLGLTNVGIAEMTEEHAVLALQSGPFLRHYFVTPKHLKRIMLLFKDAIEKYEAKFGELKTELAKQAPEIKKDSEIGFQAKE